MTVVLEKVTLTTPLGVRFWDFVTNRPIADALEAWLYQADRPKQRSYGLFNRAAVCVFQNVPGLRGFERAVGDDDPWSVVMPKPWVLEVHDAERRFLPCRFQLAVPHQGLDHQASLLVASPPSDMPALPPNSIPLFSAPQRSVGNDMAIVRAELHDQVLNQPAAWAFVTLHHKQQIVSYGMTDQRGRLTLLFAYPEVNQSVLGSPPTSRKRALSEQTWELTVTVRYGAITPPPTVPTWHDVMQQPPATLVSGSSCTLAFGQELNLKIRTIQL